MTAAWRDGVAVMVAADSPAGRVAEILDQLARHLPAPRAVSCSCCSTEGWPCSGFDDAAHRLQAAGLRLSEFVPLDLRSRVWPPPKEVQGAPPRLDRRLPVWPGKEPHDG